MVRRGTWLLGAAAVVGAAGCALWLRRVEVEGPSMEPTLAAGDRLLVRRGRRAGRGDVVVVRLPSGREVVKRVAGVAGDRMELGGRAVVLGSGEVAVLGDRPERSTDSRQLGPLPVGAVRGSVRSRYYPPDRAGGRAVLERVTVDPARQTAPHPR